MSSEAGVFVRIGGKVLPLIKLRFVAVDDDDIPSEAFAPIRCDTCAALSVIGAPVTYKFYDDDHVFRFEVWYESHHAGGCVGCGAALEVELSYTRRGESSRELREFGLDGVQAKGGKLASTDGIAIPEEGLQTPPPDLGKGDPSGDPGQ